MGTNTKSKVKSFGHPDTYWKGREQIKFYMKECTQNLELGCPIEM